MNVQIDAMRKRDWGRVKAIYAEGLAAGLAAFATTPPTWAAWDRGHFDTGRLVARTPGGAILGWAALAPVPDT